MAPGVLHEVIAAHEALVTKRAPKLLLPRVGAIVAGQLIGASELLTAVGPGTWERSFSCNTQREVGVLNHTRNSNMALRTSLYLSKFCFDHFLIADHIPRFCFSPYSVDLFSQKNNTPHLCYIPSSQRFPLNSVSYENLLSKM